MVEILQVLAILAVGIVLGIFMVCLIAGNTYDEELEEAYERGKKDERERIRHWIHEHSDNLPTDDDGLIIF